MCIRDSNYTVREFRAEQGEMDIDFVVHGTEGFAGNWACLLYTSRCV